MAFRYSKIPLLLLGLLLVFARPVEAESWDQDLPHLRFVPKNSNYEYIFQSGWLWFRELKGGYKAPWHKYPEEIVDFRPPLFLTGSKKLMVIHGSQNGADSSGIPRGGVWPVQWQAHHSLPDTDKLWPRILGITEDRLVLYETQGPEQIRVLGKIAIKGRQTWMYHPKLNGQIIRGVRHINGKQFVLRDGVSSYDSYSFVNGDKIVKTSGDVPVVVHHSPASDEIHNIRPRFVTSEGLLLSHGPDPRLYAVRPADGRLVEVEASPLDLELIRNPLRMEGSMLLVKGNRLFVVVPTADGRFVAVYVDLQSRRVVTMGSRGKSQWVLAAAGSGYEEHALRKGIPLKALVRLTADVRSKDAYLIGRDEGRNEPRIHIEGHQYPDKDTPEYTRALAALGVHRRKPESRGARLDSCAELISLLQPGEAQFELDFDAELARRARRFR